MKNSLLLYRMREIIQEYSYSNGIHTTAVFQSCLFTRLTALRFQNSWYGSLSIMDYLPADQTILVLVRMSIVGNYLSTET